MEPITITITEEQREAICFALDLAHDDQENYLDYGQPDIDYGDEWEEAKAFKASRFRLLGEVGKMLGLFGEPERWNALADQLEGIERCPSCGVVMEETGDRWCGTCPRCADIAANFAAGQLQAIAADSQGGAPCG